ncbi:MAG: ABC transporter substrate-binding protein [Thermodesulfobacteriota bacterium]
MKQIRDYPYYFLIFGILSLQVLLIFPHVLAGSQHSVPDYRIIALNSDSLEALRILGAQSMVVGVSGMTVKEPLLREEIAGLPVVGEWNEPGYEKIYSLRPDLVLTYKNYPGPELEKKLRGINILRLDLYKPSTLAEEIRALGKTVHREDKAESFIHWYRKELAEIRARVRNATRSPTVYMESYSPCQALGPGSGGYEMCNLAGGKNISSTVSIPYPSITSEWILTKQPEIIVKAALIGGYSERSNTLLKDLRQKMINRPGWKKIKAVKNKRVLVLASDICTGPGAIVGIAYMARWFYPEECADLNPERIHRQYLKKFQGIDYRGCYTWPPPGVNL